MFGVNLLETTHILQGQGIKEDRDAQETTDIAT